MSVLLALAVTWLICHLIGLRIGRSARRQQTADRIRTDLLDADRRLDGEHRQARRAMNDAAGQSWRNLAG